MTEPRARRRWLVAEVVQSSAMDCGPAALKALLDGFGLPVSYGRLREACQTSIDGTSIDALEEVANALGITAEQTVLPPDHLLLTEAEALPAIVIARLPNGLAHFVVVWRRHGGVVQVMDPAIGRRFVPIRRFLDEVYRYGVPVDAVEWRSCATGPHFLACVERRLTELGIERSARRAHLNAAAAAPGWRTVATLDAAVRMATSLVAAGGVARGGEAARLIDGLVAADTAAPAPASTIPDEYWSALPAPAGSGAPQVVIRGAIALVAHGAGVASVSAPAAAVAPALLESSPSPIRVLLRAIGADGVPWPLGIAAAAALAAAAIVFEGLLLSGLLGSALAGSASVTPDALLLVATFSVALLCLEVSTALATQWVGRRLEARLRIRLLEKVPRLGDRYLRSRLTSDMADRNHRLHVVRAFPDLALGAVHGVVSLACVVAAIAWLDPSLALIAAAAAALSIAIPLAGHPVLAERDLRQRSHAGALGRFYLDAFLGLLAIRSHTAERAVRREHEELLVEWAGAGKALQRAAVLVDGTQAIAGLGLAAAIVIGHDAGGGGGADVLLLAYWALLLPTLGQQIAAVARRYPALRNACLRMLEPLNALEEGGVRDATVGEVPSTGPVAISIREVDVVAGGHSVLAGVSLDIPAGRHVAIVGASGSGKSSLVGLLLGWHQPSTGEVLVDGMRVGGAFLDGLRARTAWVDPEVYLWNRSLLDNLLYGTLDGAVDGLRDAIEAADIRAVLQTLPAGYRSTLGEGGALLSGGEGQRVRFARALLRLDPALAILDEPFRGLDRGRRQALLARARARWSNATLLCITHDVAEATCFDEVIVMDGGAIAERGDPGVLLATPGSRFAELAAVERDVHRALWHGAFRRMRLDDGRLVELVDEEPAA